jgi:oligoribonuclease
MSHPEDSKVVAFLDLETTGNRPSDRIIEIGIVLTDRNLEPIEAYSRVVQPLGWPLYVESMEPEVRDMHTVNGLIDDVTRNGVPMADVDREVADLLRAHNGRAHVPLAGSGVGHFDRRYIRAEMPQTDDRIAYWSYDIGVVRRFLKWWDISVPEADASKDMKTHRALDDAYAALSATRAYRDALVGHERSLAELSAVTVDPRCF